jgi:MYXO-CTERM domain-containing protein
MNDMPMVFELRVVAPEVPVPRNGSILIIAAADGFVAPLDPPIVQVSTTVGATTTTFAGTLRQVVDPYWTWTPAEPLEVGQYLVSIAHAAIGTMSATITIVDDVVLAPPVLASEPMAIVSRYPSQYEYCKRRVGSELIDDSTFVTRVAGRVSVTANLTSSVVPSIFNQYLYRAFRYASDVTPFVSSDALLTVGPYSEQAEEYCFGVEAMDIATGTVHTYPDVTFCAAHGDLESLAEQEPGLIEDGLYRYACMVPPSDYEELWCQANAECIEVWRSPEEIEANYCQDYFDICPDATRPDAGTSGSGRINFDAGFVDPNGSDAGDDDRDDKDESSGCSCSIARASSSPQLSALLLVTLVALTGLRARRW